MLWHNATMFFLSVILTSDSIRWALLKPVLILWYRILEPNSKDCSSTLFLTTRCSCRFCWRSNRVVPNTVCNPLVYQILIYFPVCYLCNAKPASPSSLFPIAVSRALSSPRSDSCWPVFRENLIISKTSTRVQIAVVNWQIDLNSPTSPRICRSPSLCPFFRWYNVVVQFHWNHHRNGVVV